MAWTRFHAYCGQTAMLPERGAGNCRHIVRAVPQHLSAMFLVAFQRGGAVLQRGRLPKGLSPYAERLRVPSKMVSTVMRT